MDTPLPLPEPTLMDNAEDFSLRLAIAKKAARAAGEIQRRRYQTGVRVDTKSSGIDLVTEVDHACDALLRDVLNAESDAAMLPKAFLVTEETYVEGSPMPFSLAWLVDPLDGTTNYAHGFPHFSVAIALMQNGEPVVGVIYDPMRGELFEAIKGQGAFLEKDTGEQIPLKVSHITRLDRSLLATGFPYDTHKKPEENMGLFLNFMMVCHGVRRAGSAALDLAYVACGRLDGFWEMRLSPWDVAAGSLIVQEAGGHISGFCGAPLRYDDRRIDILGAGQPQLLEAIQQVCQEKTSPIPSN